MASLYQTIGIPLSRRDFREADRWYSAFTREHGKLEFLARGAHKPLAKLSPHLEMMAEVELLLVNGKAYHTVAGAERRQAFPEIYTDITKLTLAQNALHLVDIGTKPQEADEAIYELLVSWLQFLDSAPEITAERAGFLLGSFAMKLMSLIGYQPELSDCLACKQTIAAGSYRWHALKGGVVCRSCVEKDQETWFAARAMTDETLKILRFALSEGFEEQLRPHLRGEDLLSFHEALESLIISHFPTIPSQFAPECLCGLLRVRNPARISGYFYENNHD